MERSIIIIGAGCIGLSIGWRLVQAGRPVTIVDRHQAGRGTTWLSAGMLAPDSEMGFEDESIHKLGKESMHRWASFAAEVEEVSGQSVDYRTEGTLHVATDPDSVASMRRQYEFHKTQGLGVKWLNGAEAREIEPFLAPGLPAAVFSPIDHQVDNQLLVEALKRAFVHGGGELKEGQRVKQIVPGKTPAIVLADGHRIEGQTVVLAAGAWSRQIEGIAPDARPLVRPIKGQMLQLEMALPFELGHVVWGPYAYLAPKSNGRLLLGASMEEMGFDTTVTAGILHRILEAGWEMVPGIADLAVTETWAGLRPGSRDNDPIIGFSSVPGVYYATGHYRNGILLTPITADEVARELTTGETSDWLLPFSPSRFD